MAKSKAITKPLTPPLYQTHGLIVTKGEPKECLKQLDKFIRVDPESKARFIEMADDSWGLTLELHSPSGRKALIVWINPELNLKKPEGAGTVVHEMFHVTHRIIKAVGNMGLEDCNEEAYAHLLAWLYRETMKLLN